MASSKKANELLIKPARRKRTDNAIRQKNAELVSQEDREANVRRTKIEDIRIAKELGIPVEELFNEL